MKRKFLARNIININKASDVSKKLTKKLNTHKNLIFLQNLNFDWLSFPWCSSSSTKSPSTSFSYFAKLNLNLNRLSLLFFHLVINTFSTVHSFTAELRVKFFMLKFNFPTPRSKVNIAVAAYEWIYQDDNINNLTNTWNSRVSVLLSILYAFCIHERWEGEITEASNNN